MLRKAITKTLSKSLVQPRLSTLSPLTLRPQLSHPRPPTPYTSVRMCANHGAHPPTEEVAHATQPVVAAVAPEASAAPVEGSAAAAGPARPVKEKKAKKGGIVGGMAALELEPKPEYLGSRIDLFEKWKKEADEKMAGE